MPLRLVPVLLLAATLALAGCGDDTSSGSASDTAKDDTGATSPAASASGGTGGTGGPQGSAEPADVSCDYPADPQLPVAKEVDPPPSTPSVGGDVPATLATTLGDITITLDAAAAPCTVNSFVSLATQGYFDNSPCHRLTTIEESGIAVLQCGDPTGEGTGGPGYTFADETTGEETYGAGVLAMANRGPDTNGSQFFIVYDDTPLDPDYTVFGTVDAGSLKLVQDLAAKGTVQLDSGLTAPTEDVRIESVTWG